MLEGSVTDLIQLPRTPTAAMLDAACQAMRRRQQDMGTEWLPVSNEAKARIRWDAMVAAWEAEQGAAWALDEVLDEDLLDGESRR